MFHGFVLLRISNKDADNKFISVPPGQGRSGVHFTTQSMAKVNICLLRAYRKAIGKLKVAKEAQPFADIKLPTVHTQRSKIVKKSGR